MVAINFDVNSVPSADGGFEPKPAGWYRVIKTKSDLQQTASKNGTRLQNWFKILDGEYAEQTIFVAVNWDNPSEDCMRIGRGKIGAIGKALGIHQVMDTNQLDNQPFWLKVSYKSGDGKYGGENDIMGAKNINDTPDNTGVEVPQQGIEYGQQVQQPAPAQQPMPMQQQAPMQQPAPAFTPPAGQQPWNQPAPQQVQQPAPQQVQQPVPQQQPAFQAPPAQVQQPAPQGTMPWQKQS